MSMANLMNHNRSLSVFCYFCDYNGCKMILISSDTSLPVLMIKKLSFNRMDEEYKNICHFTYGGVYYVVPNQYEVYVVCIELADREDFRLLYALESGKYNGSYRKVLRNEISSKFPITWDKKVVKEWCDNETKNTLSLCRVID